MKKLKSDAELFLKSIYGERAEEYLIIINNMINYVKERILNKRNEFDSNSPISKDYIYDTLKFGFNSIPYNKE